ncbi:MAG: class I SAM-dependent methyltransferase [Phycisphaerae bacterium]|nr:class I SAM-dependent methyltransferase [Phycisphaerae bacterium]
MKPVSLLAGLAARMVRALGPYRVGRILHQIRETNRPWFDHLAEQYLKSELPERPMSQEFLNYWLDDEALVDAVRQHSVQLGAPFYPVKIYHEITHICGELDRRPSRILEVGPGFQLGCLFCFAAAGVPRVSGIDIEPVPEPDEAFYSLLVRYLAVAGGGGWWRRAAAANTYPEISHPTSWDKVEWRDVYDRIEYTSPAPADRIPHENHAFDLVYSIDAFEHFPNPEGAANEIFRVLDPGGLSIHEIDMRHHMDMRYHKPEEALSFLQWTEREHAAVSEKYGDGRGLRDLVEGKWGKEVYCNRLRLSDFEALFRKTGFEIVRSEPLERLSHAAIKRDQFVEPFRSKSLDDLSVLVARVVLRKLA